MKTFIGMYLYAVYCRIKCNDNNNNNNKLQLGYHPVAVVYHPVAVVYHPVAVVYHPVAVVILIHGVRSSFQDFGIHIPGYTVS
jgi:hypothetical protein